MPYESVTFQGRTRRRWYPEGAVKITHKQQLGVAYVSEVRGRISVVAYAGAAAKFTFYNLYRTRKAAEESIASFFANLSTHQAAVAERRARDNSGHTFKVGDIVSNSWGYDQTNVDWYRVTRTSRTFVWLQPIAAHIGSEMGGPMAGASSPFVSVDGADASQWGFSDLKEPAEKHKAQGAHVTMRHGSGSKWDGKPLYCSWYA